MIKKAVKYQSIKMGKKVIIAYPIIATILAFLIYTTYVMGDGGTIPGMEGMTLILLFGLVIDSFSGNFKMFLQNGVSRKTMFYSNIISLAGMATIMAFISTITSIILNLFITYEPSIYSIEVIGNVSLINFYLISFVGGFLSAILVYMMAAMSGYFFAALYFRLSKVFRFLVLIGIPVFFFTTGIYSEINERSLIVRCVVRFFKISEMLNSYNSYLVSIVKIIILGILSYSLIKKAVVKAA